MVCKCCGVQSQFGILEISTVEMTLSGEILQCLAQFLRYNLGPKIDK